MRLHCLKFLLFYFFTEEKSDIDKMIVDLNKKLDQMKQSTPSEDRVNLQKQLHEQLEEKGI